MIKYLHLLFVALVFITFVGRIVLAELSPERLQQKWLKITPHVIDTLLLLTGISLIFQGNWLAKDYGWIVAKIILLTVYVSLGMVAMRQGKQRWLASTGAIICLLYIAKIAVSKQIFWFF